MTITKTHWLLISLLILFNLTGCGTIPGSQVHDEQTPPTTTEATETAISNNKANGWHEVRFRISFRKGKGAEDPKWHMGTLLANEVIKPILDQHRNHIDLWRFHRRSGPKFGHVFSFYFYSKADTAAQIHQQVKAHQLVKQLQRQKEITWLGLDDLKQNKKPEAKDTSDENWSLIMQKHWPSYIMGVSQNWLDLVHEVSNDHKQIKDLPTRYEKVNQVVTEIWQREGKHAYLHHINGIFAYRPLMMHF